MGDVILKYFPHGEDGGMCANASLEHDVNMLVEDPPPPAGLHCNCRLSISLSG